MLRINKLTDYAVLIMHHLADANGQRLSANEVAQNISLSLPTVKKVLKILCEAGLLSSTRGSEGGYGLAKGATEIRLTDIMAAIEGLPSLTECSATAHSCMHSKGCMVKHNWQAINQFISHTLESITLADMMMPLSLSKEVPLSRFAGEE